MKGNEIRKTFSNDTNQNVIKFGSGLKCLLNENFG